MIKHLIFFHKELQNNDHTLSGFESALLLVERLSINKEKTETCYLLTLSPSTLISS